MMASNKLSETKAYLRLIFGTLSVIGLLTAANILMIMSSVGTDILKPLQRNIATVAASSEIQPKKIEPPIIEINCYKKIKTVRIKTKASSTRIFFKNCKKVGRLFNESNRTQGDIFPLKRNQWTTDFISLKPGKNRIKAPLGKNIQLFEITREVTNEEGANKAL